MAHPSKIFKWASKIPASARACETSHEQTGIVHAQRLSERTRRMGGVLPERRGGSARGAGGGRGRNERDEGIG